MLSQKLVIPLFVVLLALLTGCTDPEAAARKLYNEALTYERSKQGYKAVETHQRVVKQYPSTVAAVSANERLVVLEPLARAAKKMLGGIERKHSSASKQEPKRCGSRGGRCGADFTMSPWARQCEREVGRLLKAFRQRENRYPTKEEGLKVLRDRNYFAVRREYEVCVLRFDYSNDTDEFSLEPLSVGWAKSARRPGAY